MKYIRWYDIYENIRGGTQTNDHDQNPAAPKGKENVTINQTDNPRA